MDEIRRIRFLIPPVLFVASLLWGAWLDAQAWCRLSSALSVSAAGDAVKIVAAGGLIIFAAGYIIGTVTYAALRLVFSCFGEYVGKSRFHEAAFSKETLRAVWRKLGRSSAQEEATAKAMYGIAAFDHGVLRVEYPGIHEWLVRRWTGFTLAVNSVFALAFSIIISSWIFGIRLCTPSAIWQWIVPEILFCLLLVYVAYSAQRDVENVIKFMADGPWPELRGDRGRRATMGERRNTL